MKATFLEPIFIFLGNTPNLINS
ncbi:hypothetical protein KOSB73_460018 [Klebsiella grimontii]|uniref:Uncharacterized protein n=1 Tax=Klebsiella grimontii TaxID=2058152 RepID=A0A285B9U9_9ENTR|nr:hypothetical protein KOSB73_460018 [Klebsiella grimontii]